MKKKTLLIRLFALLAYLSCALGASADDNNYDFMYNGVYYRITGSNTVEVTFKDANYQSYSGSVTIRPTVPYNGKTYQVTAIGESAFSGCTNLTRVTIPTSVTRIDFCAFSHCSGLTSIDIPNSVTHIGYMSFTECSGLRNVVIPNSVTYIDYCAFEGCSNLSDVTIGSSVSSISWFAFENCPLTRVICLATTPPEMAGGDGEAPEPTMFDYYIFSNATLYVPKGTYDAYRVATDWKNFSNIQEFSSDFEYNGIYYRITGSNTVEVTFRDERFNSYSGSVDIPPTVPYDGKTYLVTGIGEMAFSDCVNLTKVTIPNSVDYIEHSAFSHCSGLTSINIPNSVTFIGNWAFYQCSGLESVTIPNSVTSIGDNAFGNCSNMTTLTIGSSVSLIYLWTFAYCSNLTCVISLSTTPPELDAPDAVPPEDLFDSAVCSNATLWVPKGSKSAYQVANGWKKFSNIEELPYDFEKNGIYYRIISGRSNAVEVTYKYFEDGLHPTSDYSGSVTIPDEVDNNGRTYQVTAIGDYAFYNCTDLTDITIPNSVASIGDWAFYRCTGLSSVTIPNQVTSIDGFTFSSCTGLTSVTIPNSVTNIRQNAFQNCGLITSVVCMAVTPPTIEQGAFNSSIYSQATLAVPKGCLSAYQAANYWKNFSNIIELTGQYDFIVDGVIYKITDTNTVKVTYMDTDFNSYSGNVVIPDSVKYEGVTYVVTAIDGAAFGNCTNLTSVTIPNTVTSIGSGAFGYCSNLQEVVIPNSVTSIGYLAFYGCTSLTSVTIGALMNNIGLSAFNNCSLTSVTCLALTPPSMSNGAVFSNDTYSNVALEVPKGCKSAYQAADYWKNFTNIIEVTGQFDFVVDRVIYRKTGPNTVEVTSINSNLSSYSGEVEIPDSVTYDGVTYNVTAIGEAAFAKCSNLTGVAIPNSVTTIGRSAFSNCSNLNGAYEGVFILSLPNVTTIGDLAFWGCESLRNIWLGYDLTYIGCSAFDNCPNISTVLCLAYSPPAMGNSDVFSSDVYRDATLYVGRPFLSSYSNDDCWSNFWTITLWDYDFEVDGIYYCKTSNNTVEVTYEFLYETEDWYVPSNPYTGDVSIPETITSYGKTYQVTSIGLGAFMMCPDLTSVTIPETVTKIGSFAFNGSTSLTSVTCLALVPPMLVYEVFDDDTYSNATLYVPNASLSDYRAAKGWKNFTHIVGIGASILGDLNHDGVLDVSDVTAMISLVLGSGTPDLSEADLNFDGQVDVSDVTALISHVLNGTVPVAPFQAFTVNGVTFKMINVEGGTFMMGGADDDPDAYPQEFPRHQVTLSGFAIGETEVTQALWEAVMGTNPSYFPGHPNRPVDLASWDDCQEFVAALNALTGKQFRLPTEAEWEYAARGGKKSHGYMYAGSNNIDDVAWYVDNSCNVGTSSPDYGTHDVATKAPNELGLYDMSGNAWELVQDWYGTYSSTAQTDPTGPTAGTMRVVRGGCWDAGYWDGRVTARRDRAPSYKTAGLRLAL